MDNNVSIIKSKMLLIALFCVGLYCLSGCGKRDRNDFRENFNEFLGKEYPQDASHDINQHNNFIFDSGINLYFLDLEKSNDNQTYIILTVLFEDENSLYKWINNETDERKLTLKECGDIIIKYAKENNWNNDYYLFIKMQDTYDVGCNIVYDYETNDIWIPNVEYIYRTMFEKFNTFDRDIIYKTEEGRDFLIENKLCKEKHGELENNYPYSYDVYINDGKFCSVFEDYSTKY